MNYRRLKGQPLSRFSLKRKRAQVADAWCQNGELIQIWRTAAGQHYLGPADIGAYARVYNPVQLQE
jgi:hypothetical protein